VRETEREKRGTENDREEKVERTERILLGKSVIIYIYIISRANRGTVFHPEKGNISRS